jgi:hypothetical protein
MNLFGDFIAEPPTWVVVEQAKQRIKNLESEKASLEFRRADIDYRLEDIETELEEARTLLAKSMHWRRDPVYVAMQRLFYGCRSYLSGTQLELVERWLIDPRDDQITMCEVRALIFSFLPQLGFYPV